MMVDERRIKMTQRSLESAYLALPGHPDQAEAKPGVVARTVSLEYLVENFQGPRVFLDFNKDGVLIGIEVLLSSEDPDNGGATE